MFRQIVKLLKGSIFHPQWLTDRFHIKSKQGLKEIRQATILDIGSGNTSYLNLIHSSNTLYAIDYPSTNERYLGNPDIFSDARCLPIEKNKVDVVFLFEVLEHIFETEAVLAEIRRVLRPGGEFYLSIPFIYPVHDAPNDFWRFTEFGIKEILQKNGFEITNCITHGNTFLSALQMLNLSMLELCRDINRKNNIFGVVVGILIFPITIFVNFIAWPFTFLPLGKAGNFGYFLVSKLKQ